MKNFFKIFIFFLINITVFSEIKIDVNNTKPAVKQHVILTVEFLGENKSEYVIEGIENFKVISMGNRSNYTSINKKVKYSKSDVYTLCPQKEGKVTLCVKTENGIASNKIPMSVVKRTVKKEKKEKFLLRTTQYKRDYYIEEKIPFAENVVIKTSVRNYSYVAPPIFNGFSMKNITPRDNRGFPIPRRVTANGKEHIELTLFRSILEPVSVGKKTIISGGIGITEDTEDSTTDSTVYLGFRELEINILPLPEENKPLNFSGVVGELEGKYSWRKDIIDGKKALILKLQLYGSANLDKLENILNSEREDIKKYNVVEKVTSYDERVLNSVYTAEKEYEVIFFVKNEEEFKIDDIKIPYFDPVHKKYEEFIIDTKSIDTENDVIFSAEADHESEITYIPRDKIKVNNFSAFSENSEEGETYLPVDETEQERTKDIIIIVLGIICAGETAYIVFNRRKRKNKKEEL